MLAQRVGLIPLSLPFGKSSAASQLMATNRVRYVERSRPVCRTGEYYQVLNFLPVAFSEEH